MLIDRGADVNAPRLPRRYAESLHAAQKQMQKEREANAGESSVMAASSSTSLADRARHTLHLGGGSGSRTNSTASSSNLLTRMTRRPAPLAIVGQAGSTPLHFAAANGHVPIVRILLACGAIHDKADKHGHTPKMLAEANEHEEVVETLKAWEGLVEREREKMRAKVEEQKQDEPAAQDSSEQEITNTPSSSRWSKKDRATSHGSGETAQKAHLRHSLENMFQSKRRNSLRARKSALQMTAGESAVDPVSAPPSDDGNGDTVEPNLSPIDNRRSLDAGPTAPSSRRPSLPSIFEKAGKGHLGFRRSSLRRQSHAASMDAPVVAASSSSRPESFSSDLPAELINFRGRLMSRSSDFSEAQDSNSSIHSTARHMSRAALLTLFRKDPYGTPPSPSPSPPRSAPTPLPEDIDESIERIKRVSMDGARSSNGSVVTRPSSIEPGHTGRKRSASQVTFSDSVHSVGTTSSGYPWSGPTPLSAPPTTTTFDTNARSDEEEEVAEPDEELRPTATRRRSRSNPSDDLRPAPLSRSGSEVFVPSPLGQDWSKGEQAPKSILRKRTNSPGRLTMRSLPSTPISKGKKRSATMPESIPYALMDGLKDVERQRHNQDNEPSPDHDKHQGEKQDQVGESIWDRAAARQYRKSKSRNGSFNSVSSLSMHPVPPSPTASSEAVTQTASRLYSKRLPGTRARNRSVSSVSTTASGMNFSTSTYDTNFTPFTPISQTATFDQSDLDPAAIHVKKGMARRLSKRKEKEPALLYDVPVPAPKGKGVVTDPGKVAADRVRHAEQDILQSIAIGSSSSLAEQLAAYGDSLLLQKQSSRSNDSSEGTSLVAAASSDKVSRSYAAPSAVTLAKASEPVRPQFTKTDSSDSNATLKTQDSRPQRAVAPTIPTEPLPSASTAPAITIAHAPSSSIPAINRIYEDRAAAYRKKGLALKQKAPIYSAGKASSKTPVDINDHWLMAGATRRSSSGTVSPAAGDHSDPTPARRRPRVSDEDLGDHDQPRSRSTSGGSIGTASPIIATASSPHTMRQRWGDLNFKSATKNFIGKHRA
jgi:hypothetical protein